MNWTWSLSLDMQYYAISPIFIISYLYFKPLGWFLVALSSVVYTWYTWWVTVTFDLPAPGQAFLIPPTHQYIKRSYANTIVRSSPFIIAVITAFICHEYKKRSNPRRPTTKSFLRKILEYVTPFGFVFVALIPGSHLGSKWSAPMRALYTVVSRPVAIACLAYMTFRCLNGTPNCWKPFLRARSWRPMAKLSFCLFLVHPPIILFYYLSKESLLTLSFVEGCRDLIPLTIYCYFAAFLFYVFVDRPIGHLIDIAFTARQKVKEQ